MFRNLRLVYVTTKDRNEARVIGETLIKEKLAACANILDGMESIYRWKDKIETGHECILLIKSTYNNLPIVTERIKDLHSYDVPCIVSFNIAEQEGNADYLEWILNSVKKPVSAPITPKEKS
jgi:periplasmic divalent cation tolerance protein